MNNKLPKKKKKAIITAGKTKVKFSNKYSVLLLGNSISTSFKNSPRFYWERGMAMMMMRGQPKCLNFLLKSEIQNSFGQLRVELGSNADGVWRNALSTVITYRHAELQPCAYIVPTPAPWNKVVTSGDIFS